MMKQTYKLLFLLAIFLSAAMHAGAQSAGQNNIISCGGFEEWEYKEKPSGWRIEDELFPEKVTDTRPGGSGTYALKVYLNDYSFFLNPPVAVKAGRKYAFSFWHKGNTDYSQIRVSFLWYEGGVIKKRDNNLILATAYEDEWNQLKRIITVPEGVDELALRITLKSVARGNIVFDDFSMILEGGGDDPSPQPRLEAPKNLKIVAHQGEMEISWDKVDDKDVRWEVVFDDKVEITTADNSFIKTKLIQSTDHKVKVRAVKGNLLSPYTEKSGSTKRMLKTINSQDRIPYLRTVHPDGYIQGRFLSLYYNELANPDAKISYKLNGIPVEPKNNILEFPEFEGFYKQFRLEVHIDEGEGYEWEISYPQLGIKK